ncbi:hypothetical protein R6Q59_036388 [Mikania micrantha]
MNPPLVSIPDSTSAMLHIIMELAITMEYVIPPIMVNNTIKVKDVNLNFKAIKTIQNDVVFVEMIRSEFHSCVWRRELKIPAKEGGFLWWLLRCWIMNVFVMRRKEKVKGRSRIDEVMAWGSLRVKMENNLYEVGIPMESNRDRRRNWIVFMRGME